MCGFISGLSILFCWSIFLLLGAHLLWGLDLGPQSSDSSGYSREAWPGGVAWGGVAWGRGLGRRGLGRGLGRRGLGRPLCEDREKEGREEA